MNNLQFDPIFSSWFLLPIVLIFAMLGWREYHRTIKYRLLRMLALSAVLIAIIGLTLQPSIKKEVDIAGIVLLTPDYRINSVDSLLRKHHDLKVVGIEGTSPYGDSELISFNTLSEVAAQVRFIVGRGLPAHVLEGLNTIHFKFIPAALPLGITELQIPHNVVVHQQQMLSGTINASENSTLVLSGPEGVEDSLRVPKGLHPFRLSFLPKQVGQFVYHLEFSADGNSQTEPVPIDVSPERKLNILFLQKFPTAEMRALKNFLANKGHSLVLRYQVSKEEYRYEYANSSNQIIKELSGNLLGQFDLLIADEFILKSLNERERESLTRSVGEGLGVIAILNEAPKDLQWLLPIRFKPTEKDTTKILLSTAYFTLPVPRFEISPDSYLYPVLTNNGRIISGSVFHGLGKVSFQLLQETYRIQLQGDELDYAAIWSELISMTARPLIKDKITIRSAFPFYADEPLTIDIISSGSEPKLNSDGSAAPLTEHAMIDNYWHGKIWASTAGWRQLKLTGDSVSLNYFVAKEENWKSLRAANTRSQNRSLQSPRDSEMTTRAVQERKVSSLLFFLLFLFGYGFLWLAPKL